MSDLTAVHYEVIAPGTAKVTLDGPQRRNAISVPTSHALEQALARALEEEVDVVILTGANGFFSAGGDLKSHIPEGGRVGTRSARLATAHRVIRELRSTHRTVIAAVEGPAVGIGWSLALACDLVIASEDTFFAAPFADRGLVPDGGLIQQLVQSIGPKRAAELVMFPQRLPAHQAQELGLVNRVVESGLALVEAERWARRLSDGPRDALMLTKQLVNAAASGRTSDDFLAVEWLGASLAINGAEAYEGVDAFRQGRKPDFRAAASRRS